MNRANISESPIINIYCDESCHLENDGESVMLLGAVWCPKEKTHETFEHVRGLKQKHGLKRDFEIKWTKVSNGQLAFYEDVVNYFFENENLHFRCLVIPDKSLLNHEKYQQTHDEFYYKMYFNMLKVIIDPKYRHRTYLDIKDTHSATKVVKLGQVLANSHHDFERCIIDPVQIVRSHEIELLQLADLLIGAVGYCNRGFTASHAKKRLVELIKHRSGYSLVKSTLPREEKVNIFVWSPGGVA
ncbi:TPA: DUF3800 domain-containing protein [Candidatus Sumerlaeota bacterium]|jgi:hypothetical protein|nr:DUF3800 domain-containing protein [Candidatus Sumerlaeota bacterium]